MDDEEYQRKNKNPAKFQCSDLEVSVGMYKKM